MCNFRIGIVVGGVTLRGGVIGHPCCNSPGGHYYSAPNATIFSYCFSIVFCIFTFLGRVGIVVGGLIVRGGGGFRMRISTLRAPTTIMTWRLLRLVDTFYTTGPYWSMHSALRHSLSARTCPNIACPHHQGSAMYEAPSAKHPRQPSALSLKGGAEYKYLRAGLMLCFVWRCWPDSKIWGRAEYNLLPTLG